MKTNPKLAHKNRTKTFEELSYSEQSNSIKAQIMNLEKEIHANICKAGDNRKESTFKTRIEQVKNLVKRLEKEYRGKYDLS